MRTCASYRRRHLLQQLHRLLMLPPPLQQLPPPLPQQLLHRLPPLTPVPAPLPSRSKVVCPGRSCSWSPLLPVCNGRPGPRSKRRSFPSSS